MQVEHAWRPLYTDVAQNLDFVSHDEPDTRVPVTVSNPEMYQALTVMHLVQQLADKQAEHEQEMQQVTSLKESQQECINAMKHGMEV